MARAIWSGAITFGLVTIPVKLYPAIRENELHFNFLHKEDLGRIRYERTCTVCGKSVPWSDVVRGFPYGKDDYVVLNDEDFRKASPEGSQSLDIVEFVDLREINPILFELPYYLEPDRRGRHAYALLREALAESGKVGIARMVMRTREHLAALKPDGKALVVDLLHWADEVVRPDLDLPDGVKLSAAEKKTAEMLIGAMTAKFDAAEFKDRYTEDLMALIEARAQGRRAPSGKARPRAATNVVDLANVLEKSLAEAKKRARHDGPAPRSREAHGGTARRSKGRKHAA
jgi:DNA end-binding protein Ku